MARNSSTARKTDRGRVAVTAADRELAAGCSILIEPFEEGGYRGRALELPNVDGFGDTDARCMTDVREALALAIASLRVAGKPLPVPTVERRDEQVNIKLSRREKELFFAAARRDGFRSLSDFMRSLAARKVQ